MRVLTAESLDTIRTPNASVYAGTLWMDLINYRGSRRDPLRRIQRRTFVRQSIALLRCALRHGA